MPILARLACAAISGLLLYLSFEPHGIWLAGIASFTLLYAALRPWTRPVNHRLGVGGGLLVGATHALCAYALLLPWVGEFVGAEPYIALAVVNTLYILLFASIAPRLGPVAFSLWYVAVEWLHSTWPFGGFAWVRVAWGQINGPLSALAPVGGPALISAATVGIGASLAAVVMHARRSGVLTLATIAAVVLAGTLYSSSLHNTKPIGEVTVAAVQGNVPRMGLDFNAQREAVLNNHVAETERIDQDVDIVVWPENASDVNPFANAHARDRIDRAAEQVNAPILVGTITRDAAGPRNTMVVFNEDGTVGEHHHKKYLQPFGEYMPYRDFFRHFSDYVDMAGNFVPGAGSGVVHMDGIAVGVSTCYEVAFDQAGRDAIAAGAEILTTPTNNATFGFTDMTYQQLAMSRLRAKELDRAVVVAATSGVSALVNPRGEVLEQTEIFTHDHLVDTLPLRNSRTIAADHGGQIEAGLTIMGVLAAAACIVRGRRARRQPREEAPSHPHGADASTNNGK
ncbi:Apolipoprotein N-acyltransferase [Corynebacterium ciconiae DSM 44920]|uniref:apolipoprotein N-acyltransferase n=1 Tax=Corynebacterium ciconiae TaxID=227319 RepID=UPI000370C816|nr:apolipoprotein N-acyltransferase [Corynebacterium ciconiae]WKD61162.1 Apolipoprotein N-acyltransferase [Corynebacterium ciconiae DSM 44920]